MGVSHFHSFLNILTLLEWFGSLKLHSSAAGPSKASDMESSWFAGLPSTLLIVPIALIPGTTSSPSNLPLGTDQDGLWRRLFAPRT